MATNPAYEWDTAPRNLQHRFLLEDVLYGMVAMEDLGRLVGVPTPLTTAVVELACRRLGEDLRARARSLSSLGLGQLLATSASQGYRDRPGPLAKVEPRSTGRELGAGRSRHRRLAVV